MESSWEHCYADKFISFEGATDRDIASWCQRAGAILSFRTNYMPLDTATLAGELIEDILLNLEMQLMDLLFA